MINWPQVGMISEISAYGFPIENMLPKSSSKAGSNNQDPDTFAILLHPRCEEVVFITYITFICLI